ncbi:MAG: epoxide hydrolase [Pseudonocardiales bacterium]|nr:MAG: epoxide hydrolase [Pseudonocardiales bacterium]
MSASSDPQNIRLFRVAVSDNELTDLKDRLARTRWALDTPGEGWSRGVPTAYLRELSEYWQTAFDWRAAEGRLNAHPQFLTEIDGYDLHFLHVRSGNDDATPLLLVHGWPGSVAEFLDVIPLLTEDFHLVIPSLPGFGFGGRLEDEGWTSNRIAQAFVTLMKHLDYERYGVQGGDIGAFVAPIMGRLAPERIIGLHVNALITFPSGAEGELDGLTPEEYGRLERLQNFQDDMMGYSQIQGTRPKTLMHALNDSPAGQLAWIVEKFQEWTDPSSATPEDAVDRDHLLTNTSIYWFTQTAGSSANHYWETNHDPSTFAPQPKSDVPLAVLLSQTQDITIRRLAERDHTLKRWTELEHGGHFIAMENPQALARDVRAFFTERG